MRSCLFLQQPTLRQIAANCCSSYCILLHGFLSLRHKYAVTDIYKLDQKYTNNTNTCSTRSQSEHTHWPGMPHWEQYEVPGVIVLLFVPPGHLPTLPVRTAFKWALQIPSIAAGLLFFSPSLHHPFIPDSR